MKALLISSLLLIFSFNTFAVEEIVDFLSNPNAGDAPCASCDAIMESDENSSSSPVVFKVEPAYRGDKKFFNTRCYAFIDANGDYGSYGKIIRDYINAKGGADSRFFSDALPGMESAPRTCPKWGRLSDSDKMKFWVWTFASIAQIESSCDRKSVNSGRVPNASDRPRGLLQLNTLKNKRDWRGPNCKFPTLDSNREYGVYDAKNSLRCGLDIMDELLKGQNGEYRSNGKIFPTNSYWEKLRPNHSSTGGPIGELVRQFSPCH